MLDLSFGFAKHNQLFLRKKDGQLHLYFTEQTPALPLQDVQALLLFERLKYDLVCLDPEEFEKEVQRTYASSTQSSMESVEGMELAEIDDLGAVMAEIGEPEDLLESSDDAPIIKLLNAILTEAIREQASDIHVEPFEKQLRVRFRVDGILKTVLTPQLALASMLVSRIKVMARLDIAEKRLPQDGRISLKLGGRSVDLRVSTVPSTYGERVVMRLLDKGAERLTLKDLGLPQALEKGVEEALSKSHGIILVTGPTGSGKSTTLYAGLMQLNDSQRNIMTIEDPVEYNIDGINQTQVNTKADMTFAKGLRALLRQDPDVVMIGEIRDQETAQIAVQASLTGHLVLSTLHTNTAVGAITRLRDMGVESFLLSSSLVGVLAQRLVRRLCVHCKSKQPADTVECETLGVESAEIYFAEGCDHCNHTGYVGRMGLYELLPIDHEIRTLIHQDASEADIESHVRKHSPSLKQTGLQQVLAGETSLSEVLRVTQQ
jgi:general secretion pathway protein E